MSFVRLAGFFVLSGMAFGAKAATTIPFVGCPGYEGTNDTYYPPETGDPVTVDIDKSVAAHLAYYYGNENPGIIGPSGWKCFWGSSGYSGNYTLTLTPTAVLLSPDPQLSAQGAISPVIFLETVSGDSGTGMFNVNAIAQRFWPHYYDPKMYLTAGDENVASEPRIPIFQHDRYSWLSPHLANGNVTISFVKFSTSAKIGGFGTWQDGLGASDLPIDGFIFYGADPSYFPSSGSLVVRLPANMAKQKAAILSTFPAVLIKSW